MKLDDQILWYGTTRRPADKIHLKAGDLDLVYEDGFLRYIKAGDAEVLRMINHLVRDENWGTVPQRIFDEKISQSDRAFSIEYQCEAARGDILFLSKCTIQGSEDSQVSFHFSGQALTRFKKNRLGFTILHPIRECAGKEVKIGHSDGSEEAGRFPDLISPHQPFFDIKSMEWKAGNFKAMLEFHGDVFEMEDQRNWTDESFKTYAPPLSIPFPVQLEKGECFEYSLHLRVIGKPGPVGKALPGLSFEVGSKGYPLPKLGIGRSSEVNDLSGEEIALLKPLLFDHYRVDLRLSAAGWRSIFEKAQQESLKLGYPLELALFFSNPSTELKGLLEVLSGAKATISMVNVYNESHRSLQKKTISAVTGPLKKALPHLRIGGGTDAFFTELNRDRPPAGQLDFLTYSLNPQVHAFDHDSLVETLNVQSDTIRTARSFAEGKGVHISPITFKMRWNPNATGETVGNTDQLPENVDPRQMSLFGAGWTLGSVNALLGSPPDAITYYETVGMKGLVHTSKPLFPDQFPAGPGMIYPMYFVFRQLLGNKHAHFYPVVPSDPSKFAGIAYGQEGKAPDHLILANFTSEKIGIESEALFSKAKCRILEEGNIQSLMERALDFDDLPWHPLNGVVGLPPLGIGFIEVN